MPEEEKKRRAQEAYDLFRACTLQLHKKEVGNFHLVQVLGVSFYFHLNKEFIIYK